jgi:hypothetical protein
VLRRQHSIPPIEFLDDTIGIGGPDKGFGFAVVFPEVAVDGGLEVDGASGTRRIADAGG